MKFKIKTVGHKIKGGFIGMNYPAAKSHNIPFPYGKKTLLIYSHIPRNVRKHTIRHEKVEDILMRHHIDYKHAHKLALEFENAKTF